MNKLLLLALLPFALVFGTLFYIGLGTASFIKSLFTKGDE